MKKARKRKRVAAPPASQESPADGHRVANAHVDALGHVEALLSDTLVGLLRVDLQRKEEGYETMLYTWPLSDARNANMTLFVALRTLSCLSMAWRRAVRAAFEGCVQRLRALYKVPTWVQPGLVPLCIPGPKTPLHSDGRVADPENEYQSLMMLPMATLCEASVSYGTACAGCLTSFSDRDPHSITLPLPKGPMYDHGLGTGDVPWNLHVQLCPECRTNCSEREQSSEWKAIVDRRWKWSDETHEDDDMLVALAAAMHAGRWRRRGFSSSLPSGLFLRPSLGDAMPSVRGVTLEGYEEHTADVTRLYEARIYEYEAMRLFHEALVNDVVTTLVATNGVDATSTYEHVAERLSQADMCIPRMAQLACLKKNAGQQTRLALLYLFFLSELESAAGTPLTWKEIQDRATSYSEAEGAAMALHYNPYCLRDVAPPIHFAQAPGWYEEEFVPKLAERVRRLHGCAAGGGAAPGGRGDELGGAQAAGARAGAFVDLHGAGHLRPRRWRPPARGRRLRSCRPSEARRPVSYTHLTLPTKA